MSLSNAESDIMKQLQEMSEGASQQEEESKKLFQEELDKTEIPLEEEPVATEEEQELLPEEGDKEEIEGSEEISEDEEQEEELTGAKFRHKLKAEKEAREKMEREAAELRERLARLEGRAEVQQTQPAAQDAPAEEIPDPEYEPEKYAIWKAKKLEEEMQTMRQEQARLSAERQWDAMDSEIARTNPDYAKAKEFLIESEFRKIKMQYPSATDAQIRQHLKDEEYKVVGNAVKSGLDPMQHIEFMAWQAGFRPEEANPEPKEKEAPKQKSNIKNIKKNSRKNASLIGGSAAAPNDGTATARQLLEMSIADIEKFGVDKYSKAVEKIHSRNL